MTQENTHIEGPSTPLSATPPLDRQPPVTHQELGRLLKAIGGAMQDFGLSFRAALDGLGNDDLLNRIYGSASPPANSLTHHEVLARSKWVLNSLDPDSVEGLDYSVSAE